MGDIGALRGVWNIVPTPFAPSGAVDDASIAGLVSFVRATGVDGMTILGVLGEAGRLGDGERARVLAAALEAAADTIPVCVGVSHAATDRAIAFAREAEAVGAHSVMLAPPPLARPTDAALRRHYLAVAEAISIPVVVQDHPASSGVPMTSDFLLSLAAESPQCRVIKLEEEPTPPKAGRLVGGSRTCGCSAGSAARCSSRSSAGAPTGR